MSSNSCLPRVGGQCSSSVVDVWDSELWIASKIFCMNKAKWRRFTRTTHMWDNRLLGSVSYVLLLFKLNTQLSQFFWLVGFSTTSIESIQISFMKHRRWSYWSSLYHLRILPTIQYVWNMVIPSTYPFVGVSVVYILTSTIPEFYFETIWPALGAPA